MSEMAKGSIVANGIEFHYLEQGDGPLVLCLHGFPDNAETYRHLLPELAAAGFRGVAPYMRGYAPTAAPADGRYESVHLAEDAIALISVLGGPAHAVIGHDWGGGATIAAAIFQPDQISRIVTLGVTHPGATAAEPSAKYARLRSIWHAWFFQMPFAEETVAEDDFAFLIHWWSDASPTWNPTPEEIESVKATFRRPGVLSAALAYYRHTFHPDLGDPGLRERSAKIASSPVPVPWLAFFGTADRPGLQEAFAYMDERHCSAGLERVLVEHSGHFVHREAPGEVNRRIIEFLRR
jgi:pimeloyl-ACP methyl ester carboxylesterase